MTRLRILWVSVPIGLLAGCGGGSTPVVVPPPDSTAQLSARVDGTGGFLFFHANASENLRDVIFQTNSGLRYTFPDVLVGQTAFSPDFVLILKKGTRICNLTIPDPSQGARVPGSAIRVPISGDGTLQVNLLATQFVTPPAIWNGHYLPNGLTVNLKVDPANNTIFGVAEFRAQLDATVSMASTMGERRTGQCAMTTTSTMNFNDAGLRLVAADDTEISVNMVGAISAERSADRVTMVPWQTVRQNPDFGPFTFTEAVLNVSFRD